MESTHRRLMWHGMCLFLFGFLARFRRATFLQYAHGTRCALGRPHEWHLLSCAGCRLDSRAPTLTSKEGDLLDCALRSVCKLVRNHSRCCLRYGSASPITGAGHSARLWQENLVTTGFLTVGVATVVSSGLILWGLRARAAPI
jgi:hypothetical protein